MSEIPYYFDTPVPKFFRENGWFTNQKMVVFIHWAFARCSTEKRMIYHIQKAIELEPFEFIFGRRVCSEETGLTEQEIRTCINQLNTTTIGEIIKKSTSKTTNKFSVYRWVTSHFSKTNNLQNNQQPTSSQPADNHNQEYKNIRTKESHHPNPSSKVVVLKEVMTDDLSSNSDELDTPEKKRPMQHNIDYQNMQCLEEVFPSVRMSKTDLDACVAIKGSYEAVKHAVAYIMKCPARKHPIQNWPNALKTWNIKSETKAHVKKNEATGNRLHSQFCDSRGWRCELYNDYKKDQKGIRFYNSASVGDPKPIFIAFIDQDFEKKVHRCLTENRMAEVSFRSLDETKTALEG